jgi:hypothetical protein
MLDVGGVVIRYGQFGGPGTYYQDSAPDTPRIHLDDAARQTLPSLARRRVRPLGGRPHHRTRASRGELAPFALRAVPLAWRLLYRNGP